MKDVATQFETLMGHELEFENGDTYEDITVNLGEYMEESVDVSRELKCLLAMVCHPGVMLYSDTTKLGELRTMLGVNIALMTQLANSMRPFSEIKPPEDEGKN